MERWVPSNNWANDTFPENSSQANYGRRNRHENACSRKGLGAEGSRVEQFLSRCRRRQSKQYQPIVCCKTGTKETERIQSVPAESPISRESRRHNRNNRKRDRCVGIVNNLRRKTKKHRHADNKSEDWKAFPSYVHRRAIHGQRLNTSIRDYRQRCRSSDQT